MYIERKLEKTIRKRFFAGKAILLYGPRQCGKTTLIEEILRPDKGNVLFLSGDEPDVREMLGQITSTRLKSLLGKKKFLVIDEAQRIPGVGLTIKLVTDQIKEVQIIATGSSALDLAEKTSEPLTGRKFEFTLLPLSFGELAQANGTLEERRLLPTRLVFGTYPDIVVHADDATALLRSLAGSYLYKDLLMLEQIKKPVLLEKLVRALALQCGAEVSFHELGHWSERTRKPSRNTWICWRRPMWFLPCPLSRATCGTRSERAGRYSFTTAAYETQCWAIFCRWSREPISGFFGRIIFKPSAGNWC